MKHTHILCLCSLCEKRHYTYHEMSTLVVMSDGSMRHTTVAMDHDWVLSGDDSLGRMALSCAFPVGSEVVYIFGSLQRDPETVAQILPSAVADLLIFCPFVPLRKTDNGFQGISTQEWTELLVPVKSLDQPTAMSSLFETPEEDAAISDDANSSWSSSEEEELVPPPNDIDEEGASSCAVEEDEEDIMSDDDE